MFALEGLIVLIALGIFHLGHETYIEDALYNWVQLLDTYRLRDVVLDSSFRALVLNFLLIESTYCCDAYLWQTCILSPQLLLVLEDFPGSRDAIHDRHIDIGEYQFVASITARLLHARQVQVDGNLPIFSPVAGKAIISSHNGIERHQVEQLVVNEKHLSF